MSNATRATASEDGESEVLAAAGLPTEADPGRAWAQALVDRARSEGVALTGEDGLLTSMVREVLQAGLDVEMTESILGTSITSRPDETRGTAATAAIRRRSRPTSDLSSCGCQGIETARLSR
jgi:hypothetical protein